MSLSTLSDSGDVQVNEERQPLLVRGKTAVSKDSVVTATALPKWKKLTLTNDWKYGGFSTCQVAYYKDAQKVVHLRGSAYDGIGYVFRLPSGTRPAKALYLPVYALNGAPGGMLVTTAGYVYVFDVNSNSSTQDFTSFDGVQFRVP